MKKIRYILSALTLLMAGATAHAQVFDITFSENGQSRFTLQSYTLITFSINQNGKSQVFMQSGADKIKNWDVTLEHNNRYGFILTAVSTIAPGQDSGLPEGNFPAQAPRRTTEASDTPAEPALTGPALVLMRGTDDPAIYYVNATTPEVTLKLVAGKYIVNNSEVEGTVTDIFYKEPHIPVAHSAVTATCTTAGNSPYWSCSKCDKYFSDETCTKEMEKDSWVTAPDKDNHDFANSILSATPDEKGLYHYVCAYGCGTADSEKANIRVIKDYAPNAEGNAKNLELTVTTDGETTTYSTTETIALTDDNQFKDVNVKFSTTSAPTYTREMNGYQWGTLVLPFEVNIQGDDCDLYEYHTTIVHDQASNTKTITIGIIEKEEDDDDKESINAGYPAFVRKKDSEATSIKITGIKNEIDLTKMDSPNFYENMTTIGTYTPVKLTSNDEGKYFVYNTQNYWGLFNASIQLNKRTVTILPFHAYFAIPSKDAKFMIVAEDELTGINANVNDNDNKAGAVYNLNGQRISAPHKGVNIINGKKVIVK